MYKHILIPLALDHEMTAPQKIAFARRLLDEDGKITLLTVLEEIPGFVSEFVSVKAPNNLTDKIRGKLREAAGGDDGVDCIVAHGKAGVQIARYAADNGVDLIVVGSHRPGAQDYFLGSTAARVVRRAECSVHVMR
ncbi:MAG: universal stress protein [Rhodobacteraceae bacterium]|nr:universal stress protein [Paracoccaceae bacterium]